MDLVHCNIKILNYLTIYCQQQSPFTQLCHQVDIYSRCTIRWISFHRIPRGLRSTCCNVKSSQRRKFTVANVRFLTAPWLWSGHCTSYLFHRAYCSIINPPELSAGWKHCMGHHNSCLVTFYCSVDGNGCGGTGWCKSGMPVWSGSDARRCIISISSEGGRSERLTCMRSCIKGASK